MFCTKCGREIPNDSEFCPSCGNAVMKAKQEQKELSYDRDNIGKKAIHRKWIKPIGFAVAAISIMIIGITLISGMFSSNKRALTAYKEYYQKFYKESAGGLGNSEADAFDCTGRIVMAPDGKLMMSIIDITQAPTDDEYDSDIREDVYLYSYEKGKIVKRAELHNICIDDYAFFSAIDDKLYFTYDDWRKKGMTTYVLDEKSEFEEVTWRLKKGEKKGILNKAGDKKEMYEEPEKYETDTGISYTRWSYLTGLRSDGYGNKNDYASLFLSNAANLMNGKDFEYIIENLLDKDIKTQTDLQLFYGSMIKKLNIWGRVSDFFGADDIMPDYPVVAIEETKDGYYGIRMSGNASLLSAKKRNGLTDIKDALKEANGRKVTRIEHAAFSRCKKLETVDIPDNITFIGSYAFSGCPNLKCVRITDNVIKIGSYAFSDCPELEKAEISDNAEVIGENLFGDNLNGLCSVIVFCKKGTMIQKYAVENQIYYINGTIDSADKTEVEKMLQKRVEIKQTVRALKLYEERYQQAKEGSGYDISVSLIYLNNDKIPECVMWYCVDTQVYQVTILSYADNSLIEEEINVTSLGFDKIYYTPMSGDFYLNIQWNSDITTYAIYKLNNRFETVGFAGWEGMNIGEENAQYEFVGEDIDSIGELKGRLNELGSDYVMVDDSYQSVTEAYNELKK